MKSRHGGPIYSGPSPKDATSNLDHESQRQCRHSVNPEGADQPDDLWDRAYSLLVDDKEGRKLIYVYEKVLQAEIGGTNPPDVFTSENISGRQIRLSSLVSKKLKQMDDDSWWFQFGERVVEVKAQVDRVLKAVVFAKDFVSSVASTEPHAALAWAGVSMLLPLLLNFSAQTDPLVEGIDFISLIIVQFTVNVSFQQEPKPPSS